MKQDTKKLLDGAARMLRLMEHVVVDSEQLTSADFLDLIVSCEHVKTILEDAHQAEHGV